MWTRDQAKQLCEDILARSPADGTEIVISAGSGNSLRLAESGPSEQNALSELTIDLRLIRGERQGRARASSSDPVTIQKAIDAAWTAAELSPALELPPLAGASQGGDGGQDPERALALAEHAPETKIAELEAYLGRVREAGATATGFYETGGSSLTYATSNGCFRHAFSGTAGFSSTVLMQDGAGVGHVIANGKPLTPEEVDAAGQRALDKCLASRNPIEVEPKAWRVLLEPRPVSDLLLFMSWAGFGARAFLEGRSFMSGKLGERVLSDKMTIRDDGTADCFARPAFDMEGQDRQPVTLVEGGIARSVVWDRVTAAEGKTESTGHAGVQPSAGGPQVSSVIFDAAGPTSSDMMSELGDGLLVTQFHYTNLSEPLPVVVTGMTRNGTFLVEDGKVKHAVKNMRFTQSLVEAFGDVAAVGDDPTLCEAFFGGSMLTRSMVLPAFRFTSSTSF
jgi:PmbA protein